MAICVLSSSALGRVKTARAGAGPNRPFAHGEPRGIGFEAKSMQWAALMSRPVSPAPSGDITFDDLS
jgi:hypothetical protein